MKYFWSYLTLVLYVAILLFLFVLMNEEDQKPGPHSNPLLWLFVGYLFLSWIPLVLILRFIDRESAEDANSVPQEIQYSRDDNYSYVSKRRADHLWYGDNHPDLNWQHREHAQSWGMDSDTYVDNFLDSDK